MHVSIDVWKVTSTVVLVAGAALLLVVVRGVAQAMPRERVRGRFWTAQAARIVATLTLVIGLAAIWFDNPSRFASVAAFITAGLTIALQKVVTSIAGYVSILRGNVFTVGDRIRMGGVRGDVVGLSYLRTTVMEMGQPPAAQADEPAMWVSGRQYTGRIVTITNDKIFDTPVYNYTREFPFLWDEMRFPIRYGDDWQRAEAVLVDAAREATNDIVAEARPALQTLLARYPALEPPELEPRVYVRLTDNWNELTLRFLCRARGVRNLKNGMSRDILQKLTEAKIGIASSTFEVVGVAPLSVRLTP